MNRRPSVLIIFLTVFIDLIGFGIIMPLIPIYSKHFGSSEHFIGVIIASFSAMQFIFAPIWGRVSDRIGRRPVLLVSTAGAAISYALFAIGSGLANHAVSLWVLLGSRALAGICGGNITVAQAYIADITPPQDRSRKMGLIGMAFGLGFICGPIIGGLSLKYLGNPGPGWVAAAICAANFFLALFILVESRKPTSEHAVQRPHLDQWMHTLTQPKVGLLVIVFFLATFCFSCFESTLALLVCENFHLDILNDPRTASTAVYLFAFCGIISAFVQGGVIGRLVRKLGEPKLIAFSLALTGFSMAGIPFVRGTTQLTWGVLFQSAGVPWLMLLALLALLAIGSGLTRPPLFGLLSNLTPSHEQGSTIGVAQGAGSLARILGPMYAFTLFGKVLMIPFVTCAAICLATSLFVMQRLSRDETASVAASAQK